MVVFVGVLFRRPHLLVSAAETWPCQLAHIIFSRTRLENDNSTLYSVKANDNENSHRSIPLQPSPLFTPEPLGQLSVQQRWLGETLHED